MVEHLHMGAIRVKDGKAQILNRIDHREGKLVLRWDDYAKHILSIYMTGKEPTAYTSFIRLINDEFPDSDYQVITL